MYACSLTLYFRLDTYWLHILRPNATAWIHWGLPHHERGPVWTRQAIPRYVYLCFVCTRAARNTQHNYAHTQTVFGKYYLLTTILRYIHAQAACTRAQLPHFYKFFYVDNFWWQRSHQNARSWLGWCGTCPPQVSECGDTQLWCCSLGPLSHLRERYVHVLCFCVCVGE